MFTSLEEAMKEKLIKETVFVKNHRPYAFVYGAIINGEACVFTAKGRLTREMSKALSVEPVIVVAQKDNRRIINDICRRVNETQVRLGRQATPVECIYA